MQKKISGTYPVEVAVTLDDLMRFEYMVSAGNILPNHPIYSILAGRHAARMRGRGLDFEEVRLYVPGDDIRNIDWKVTARSNNTYSKVFNEEKERPTFTLLDQSPAMFFGSERYVKSVIAAQVAALTAFYTIKRGDRFGGIIFNGSGYDYLSPRRNKAQVQHYLQLVVEHNNALTQRKGTIPDTGQVNDMLRRAQALVTHDYVVTVITDLLMLNEDSKHLLRSMALRNDLILVHIEDPMDKHLPQGKLVLTDGDRQITWNNKKNGWGEKYTSDYEHRMAALTEDFRHYRIPVSVINTVTPVELQIKEKMGERLKQ